MSGPGQEDITLQFTIRQMAIGIAVIGIVLALAVRAPGLLVAGGDAVLIGFGAHKLNRWVLAKDRPADETPWPPVWFRIAMAMVLAVLTVGLLIGWLYTVISY